LVPIPQDRLRTPNPVPPDPYCAGSWFLEWLAKHRRRQTRSICEDKWKYFNETYPTPELEGWDLDDYIKYLESNIDETGRILRTKRDPHLGKIVEITSKGVDWAGEWNIKYENARDHHGQPSRRRY